VTATILVVNDEPGVLTLFQIVLQRAGYQTLKAKDGLEAFEVAKAQVPDLVVSDTIMPRAHGRKLLQMLRTEPTTSHIPFILVAVGGAWHLETDAEYIEDLLLTIPFDLPELPKHVEKLLTQKGV
jgi:CheY-like chemotaxis protein